MAHCLNQPLRECHVCFKELGSEFDTLSCSHAFCHQCLDKLLSGETDKQCPNCHNDDSQELEGLSPSLMFSLQRRQLESAQWKCDWCTVDRFESAAIDWCQSCKEFFCDHCTTIHSKFFLEHNSRSLARMDRDQVIREIVRDIRSPCPPHHKLKVCYCERCNMFYCDECYGIHLANSLLCSAGELPAKNLIFDKLLDMQSVTMHISSICVSRDDDHIFICDGNNRLIMEFTEFSEFISGCVLFDGQKKYAPRDICSLPPNLLVIACGKDKKLFFLERKTVPPFLQIKKIVETRKEYYSLSQMNDLIVACNLILQVDFLTNEGECIKTFSTKSFTRGFFYPRISADPTNGNIWLTRVHSHEVFCYDVNGGKLRKVETGGRGITDICVNETGHLYYCNSSRIVSNFLKRDLCIFKQVSRADTKIFASKDKVFVTLDIDGKYSIRIFKLFK